MSVRYQVRHVTRYRYGTPVSAGYNVAFLTPRSTLTQVVERTDLTIDPGPHERYSHLDVFGNEATYWSMTRPHDDVTITATSVVRLDATGMLPRADDIGWEATVRALDVGRSAELLAARPFRVSSPLVPSIAGLREFAAQSFAPGRTLEDALVDLNHRIFAGFEFDADFSEVSTPLSEVLAHRRGVCQDFAHLMVGAVRSVGLAARYVSGYIETEPPPGVEKLVGTDASHAWCSVFVPGAGWLELDPTNDAVRPDRHVVVAWGRDYSDVAPVRGVVFGPPSAQRLDVGVDVQRLDDAGGAPTDHTSASSRTS
ncbi:MAG: transglutaminase family protein [Ilumatobacteraceae bacterium]